MFLTVALFQLIRLTGPIQSLGRDVHELTVPLQKTLFLVDWRLLVKERIAIAYLQRSLGFAISMIFCVPKFSLGFLGLFVQQILLFQKIPKTYKIFRCIRRLIFTKKTVQFHTVLEKPLASFHWFFLTNYELSYENIN